MKTKLLRTFVALLLTTLANVTAWAADTEPPTISNKKITVTGTDYKTINIKWDKATDNLTPQKDLLYTIKFKAPTDELYFTRSFNDINSYTVQYNGSSLGCEIIISVRDKAGNYSYYETLYAKPKADTEPPRIPNKNIEATLTFSPGNLYTSSTSRLKLAWAMAEDKQTNIYHKLYHKEPGHSTYEQVFGYMYDYVDIHNNQYNRTFENLQPGTHGFKVVVYDAAGNQSEYNPLTYTIPESAAPTLPSPYLYRYNITDQSVELKWERATDDMTKQSELKYRVFCRQKEGDKFVRVLHGVKDMTYAKVSGLKPNTWYEFLVDVYDTEANITYYESAFAKTLPTDYENDKVAPTLSNKKLTITNATDNSLTLNWTKAKDNLFDDEDLDYTVMYKEASSARYSKDGAEQGKNISSSHISSLQPNTTYEFIVRVKDGVGNTSTYDILTYTTSNTQDRTAPTISNKTVTATGATYGSVTLNWNKATDNVTKQENLQYSVFRDGVLCKKMQNETSYIVGDLKPSTKYTFEIRVEDEAGNISKYNTVQATTKAKPVTVTTYPLFIEGTQVTSANANDFWGDGGSIKYDPTTKTLHLNWADLYSTSNTLVINDDITINLVGWTTISGNINAASSSKVTIKADDNNGENAQLKIQNGYFYGNCDLTIKNECTVEIDATSNGNTSGLILNSHQLSVYGSTLKVKGDGKNATVSGISALSMTDCHITSDYKYAAASKTFLNASGDVAKDDVVISTEIIRVPVLVNDEIEVEGATEDGALLSWVPATDDATPQSELVYTLYTMRKYGDSDYSFYKDGRNLTSCKLYNLMPNTEYYAKVRVEDKDGNHTFYKETSFKTLPESDKTAPTLANGSINVTDVTYSSVSISWAKASDDRTAQDKLIYFAGYKKSSEPESSWERDVHNPIANGYNMTSCTAENLEPETSYDFYVVVYDGESNGATYTKTTVVTEALPDVTAPSLGEVTISVDDVTEKSIAMTWSPATDDRTPQDKLAYTVEYKKAGESVWNANNAGNSKSYTIGGLTKGTDYEVRISVADEAGNVAVYGEFTVPTASSSSLKGDVNGDNIVNISDVTALVNIILGKAVDKNGTADVNEDNIVNISDVTTLVNIILGK